MHYDESVKKRLRRVEGQVRGVLNMMETGAPCKEVVNQLAAIRSAVDRALALIVASNLERCLSETKEAGAAARDKAVREAVRLLVRSR
ncbi:MAG TPA: metal-sensitive transcriptional regulator [Paenibacillaceae bacterium]